jgi:phytoene dehydrogenase-like protein
VGGPTGKRKIAIIGAGIAGLCAGVYAKRCGYEVELLEQHEAPGGLATSWRRGDYTFETCLHWLLGSNPRGWLHAQWQEVFDIDRLAFVQHEECERLETEGGERLSIYSDADRMEAELLKRAPEDTAEIHRLASTVRSLAKLRMPDPAGPWPRKWEALALAAPHLLQLRQLSKMTAEEYGSRFSHPLLKSFFGGGDFGRMSVMTLLFTLAWMTAQNAGYPIGGSQAVIRSIAERFANLGGRMRFGAKVESILVDRNAAVGVRLAGGETIAADWIISAADGHGTIYELLGGKYTDEATDKAYRTLETFPSFLQVSLGITMDLSHQPPYLTRLLDAPIDVDPGTALRRVSFRFFHFDPTFAPAGKTAVTCFLPTRNFEFWVQLQGRSPEKYQGKKRSIAEAVIAILERIAPSVRRAIEVIDVSTPATVIRYTGNWKGSMEGWLLTPSIGFRQLRNTLPGLRRFLMAGQWVRPGGGLPTGLMTARSAVQSLCKQDRVAFAVRRNEESVPSSGVIT